MKHLIHVTEELNRLTKQILAPGDTAEFVGDPTDASVIGAGNQDARSHSTAFEGAVRESEQKE